MKEEKKWDGKTFVKYDRLSHIVEDKVIFQKVQ